MRSRSVRLFSATSSRNADAHTIGSLGIPGLVLMEHAGRACALKVRELGVGRATVVCGPGNNGGDGLVIARHLLALGVDVDVFAMSTDLDGDALKALQLFEAQGVVRPSVELTQPPQTELVVDALFGTGLSRPLQGEAARLVELLNVGPPVLAVDIPSGVSADGRAPNGPHLVAAWTVTFGGLKIGHAAAPTTFFCGEVTDAEIGIFPGDEGDVFLAPELAPEVRPPWSHKGRYGHVGVLAGSEKTPGAAHLAAYAALRAGSGKVSLLGADEPPRPELMCRHRLEVDGLSALVVGPGLGARRDDARPVLAAAKAQGVPLVVDAEALDLLKDTALERAVATPHPGEAARLLETTTAEVQSDRMAAHAALTELSDVVWVLKGACPVVGDRKTRFIVPGGNPALAVGGSGDVLAGVIAAELVKRDVLEAAVVGCQRHQSAGARLAAGALAQEIADALR